VFIPLSLNFLSISLKYIFSSVFKPAAGSSRSKNFGSDIIALPSSTSFCVPYGRKDG